MKKTTPLTVFLLLFTIIGIGLILGAVLIFGNGMRFKQSSVDVTGEIADIMSYYDDDGDAHYQVFVTYDYEGKTYERVRLSEYSSDMYVGDSILLLCDPEHPEKVKTESGFYIETIVLAIIGPIFFCIGAVPLIFIIRKKQQRKYLLTNGRVLYATVERIGLNTSYYVNGQNPYVIYCTWKDDYADRLYRFKSDNLWTDPGIVFCEGSEIKVYVNENDYSKYYVDAQRILSQKVSDYTVSAYR